MLIKIIEKVATCKPNILDITWYLSTAGNSLLTAFHVGVFIFMFCIINNKEKKDRFKVLFFSMDLLNEIF